MVGYIPLNIIEAIQREKLPDPRIQVMIAESPFRYRHQPRYRIGALLVRLGRSLQGTTPAVAAPSAA